MTLHRRALFIVAAAAWCGCTLVTSLSGLSGGADVSADGGQEAMSSAESGAGDALVVADGDAAAAEASMDAAPFCTRADAGFCEDFDDAAALGRWMLSSILRASHGVDGLAAVSKPASLWATNETLLNGQEAHSYRTVSFTKRATELSVAFDLYIEQRGAQAFVIVNFGLNDLADSLQRSIGLVLNPTGDAIEEAREGATNSYNDHALSSLLPVGSPTRIAIRITRQPDASYRVLTTRNGVVALDEALTLLTGISSGEPFAAVGAFYARGPSAPWRVRVDNFTFDTK